MTREERMTVGVLVAALVVGGSILAYRAYLAPRWRAGAPSEESAAGGTAADGRADAGAPGGAPGPAAAAPPPDPGAPAPAPRDYRRILVHVAGAVARPGLYELPRGSRGRDAIAAAGGETEEARLDGVNLAALLSDGARVYVPPKPRERAASPARAAPAPGGPPAAPPAPSWPLDLNVATLEQLETVPGIGPATAERILRHRGARGPFRRVEDLLDVPGIGPRRLEELRQYLHVGPSSAPSEPAPAAESGPSGRGTAERK